MKNEPFNEPYYEALTGLGYLPYNYSEKHYIFVKGDKILKIARSNYDSAILDESYYVERKAHEILISNGLSVAKICRIYEKGELVNNFTALEEEKAEGQVFYNKNSDKNILKSILVFMENATQIKSNRFGMMNGNGEAKFSSWKEYLSSVIAKSNCEDKEYFKRELNKIPDITQSSFVITDCNTANFVFENGKLKCTLDVERPLWGDKNFLYGIIKARNPYMFELVENRIKPQGEIIDFYSKIYNLIFE